MSRQFLSEARLAALISAGDFAERLATVGSEGGLRYARIEPDNVAAIDLRSARSADATRALFFGARSRVAAYGPVAESWKEPKAIPPRMVAGLRACDLEALAYLDVVMLDDQQSDPFYKAVREATFIISVDCVKPHEKCFCTVVGGSPYPKSGFDVNLTPIQGGYLVEAGSDTGREFLDACRDLLEPASEVQTQDQADVRSAAERSLAEQNAELQPAAPPEEVLSGLEGAAEWDRYGADCVECGACTQICPTCHCFYLWDQRADGQIYHRFRAWDSCLFSGYSRMAGVAGMKPNPRARLSARFSNRFLHKYAWSPKQWGRLGCVGCGRCSEACLGEIDIRQVVREMTQCAAKR